MSDIGRTSLDEIALYGAPVYSETDDYVPKELRSAGSQEEYDYLSNIHLGNTALNLTLFTLGYELMPFKIREDLGFRQGSWKIRLGIGGPQFELVNGSRFLITLT